jgi:hypothetical protein
LIHFVVMVNVGEEVGEEDDCVEGVEVGILEGIEVGLARCAILAV